MQQFQQGSLFDYGILEDEEDELNYEGEVFYDKASKTTVTQQRDPDFPDLFIYRCYDDSDILFSQWKHRENLAEMPTSQFDKCACRKIIADEIVKHMKDPNYRFNSMDASNFKHQSSRSYYSYPRYHWEPSYISKEEAFKKYNNSNTLCFHRYDPTTTMLSQIYEGKGWDVVNNSSEMSSETIADLIDSHDRIVMLGHGSGGGLIGFIGPDHAKHLEPKKLFALWCNADAYCNRYLPNKKGFFACGNMPSDDGEAKWVGYNVSHKYMDDNITYWCKLCGDVVEQCLEGDADKGCQYIREKYWEKYGHSDDPDETGITLYNYQRTKVAGQDLIDPPADYVPPVVDKKVPTIISDDGIFDENGELITDDDIIDFTTKGDTR